MNVDKVYEFRYPLGFAENFVQKARIYINNLLNSDDEFNTEQILLKTELIEINPKFKVTNKKETSSKDIYTLIVEDIHLTTHSTYKTNKINNEPLEVKIITPYTTAENTHLTDHTGKPFEIQNYPYPDVAKQISALIKEDENGSRTDFANPNINLQYIAEDRRENPKELIRAVQEYNTTMNEQI